MGVCIFLTEFLILSIVFFLILSAILYAPVEIIQNGSLFESEFSLMCIMPHGNMNQNL